MGSVHTRFTFRFLCPFSRKRHKARVSKLTRRRWAMNHFMTNSTHFVIIIINAQPRLRPCIDSTHVLPTTYLCTIYKAVFGLKRRYNLNQMRFISSKWIHWPIYQCSGYNTNTYWFENPLQTPTLLHEKIKDVNFVARRPPSILVAITTKCLIRARTKMINGQSLNINVNASTVSRVGRL